MSFATDPIYDNVLRMYFAETPGIGQEVWERYVQYVTPWMQTNPSFVEFLEMHIRKPGSIQTLSDVTAFPGGIYTKALDQYFGYRPPIDRLNIWRAFLSLEGYPIGGKIEPTEEELSAKEFQNKFENFVSGLANIEKQTLESLRSFASQYNAYRFDSKTLSMDAVTTIPGGFYTDYLKAFFGARTPIEPFDIWRSFLVSIGYPKKDPVTGEIIYEPPREELDSSAMKEAFKRHVDTIRSRELTFAAATSDTPHQIEMSSILYDVMGSLRNMLNTTEQLVRNQAFALIASGKIQQEYTTMLSRIPNLTSGDPGQMLVPSAAKLTDKTKTWDLSEEFLFGYNRINLQEVLDYGIDSAFRTLGTTITYEQPPGCKYLFRVETSEGVPTTFKLTFQYSGIDATEEIPLYGSEGRLSREECSQAVGDAIKKIFAVEANATKVAALTGQTGIQGRYLTKGDVDTEGTEAALRSEQNALLQTYVENIRSLRNLAKTDTSNLQAIMTETKEKINLHTSLWTSILEMIDEIIHSIFMKK